VQLGDEPRHDSSAAQDPSPQVVLTARERFLTTSMKIALALYGVFAITFSYFQVKGDGVIYFNLLRRYFGEHLPEGAVAYQFGSALWNAPFFLVGKLLASLFGNQPKIFHVSFEEIAITFAANAALLLTLYLGWRILEELGLPRHAGVLFLTVFGTPLFFYVIFDPSGKHAADTLVLTAATYAFMRTTTSSTGIRTALALGALAGWSINIRWVNVVFFVVLALSLALAGRARHALAGAGVACAVALAIFALPALRGIPYLIPSYFPPDQSGAIHLAAAPGTLAAPAPFDPQEEYDDPLKNFDATIPLMMLFSEHRGLFLWTPLTAFAVLGFVLALVRLRNTRMLRAFLLPLSLAALALLGSHVIWAQWDGGFAFSQRFLTGLFPIYLIGIAELVRRVRYPIYPVLVGAAVFSLWLAFVRDNGYDGISERDGVGRVVEAGWESRRQVRLYIQDDAKARWVYLWGLVEGRDSKCINEPPGTTEC
jgi:hypothetical protein